MVYLIHLLAMTNLPTKFYDNQLSTFLVILLTDKQTKQPNNKQV